MELLYTESGAVTWSPAGEGWPVPALDAASAEATIRTIDVCHADGPACLDACGGLPRGVPHWHSARGADGARLCAICRGTISDRRLTRRIRILVTCVYPIGNGDRDAVIAGLPLPF